MLLFLMTTIFGMLEMIQHVQENVHIATSKRQCHDSLHNIIWRQKYDKLSHRNERKIKSFKTKHRTSKSSLYNPKASFL